MRVGLAVSIAAHAAILATGLVAFPNARPFEVDAIQALPVDLVEISDVTDLKLGDRNAKEAPKDNPQPKPQVQAETPAPKPAERPAPKPVEQAQAPQPKPAPQPEPAPEPERVAEAPPAPEPAPSPEPAPEPVAETPQPAPKPRARPEPPKQVARVEPPKEPVREAVRPTPPAPEPDQTFNPDDIAALLNKQQPAGGGDPEPVTEPQTLGSIDGSADAAMTQSEIDALKARLYQCWNPPVGVREAAGLAVTVAISLQPDGALATRPQVIGGGFNDPLWTVAADSAVRAVLQCSPFDILPPEKYAEWREIQFTFDPREMFGG